jgi:putative endonuclease
MTLPKIDGRDAEALAASYLADRGFVILGRNVRVGRLELDVIAQRGALLVVCEVRSRRSSAIVEPWETVDRAKQERLRKATRAWLSANRVRISGVRFDVASVVFDAEPPRFEYFAAAFE